MMMDCDAFMRVLGDVGLLNEVFFGIEKTKLVIGLMIFKFFV